MEVRRAKKRRKEQAVWERRAGESVGFGEGQEVRSLLLEGGCSLPLPYLLLAGFPG